jgi:RNA polymerase sigma-70 factor (ECF subfamily)
MARPEPTPYRRLHVDDVTTLVLAARTGDPLAQSALVRQTWNDVARLVTAVAGRDLAEDATQDAYLRAIRALPSYRGDANGRTWLLSIARRAAIDAVRGATRRQRLMARLTARAEAHTIDIPLGDLTLTDHLLHGLDPDRRTAFALTQLLGLSYADAATICGCPVGTIRSRVARARTHLIRQLATDPDAPRSRQGPMRGTGSMGS